MLGVLCAARASQTFSQAGTLSQATEYQSDIRLLKSFAQVQITGEFAIFSIFTTSEVSSE